MPIYQDKYDESIDWFDRFSMVRPSDEEMEECFDDLEDEEDESSEGYVDETDDQSVEDVLDGQAPLVRDAMISGRNVFKKKHNGIAVKVKVPYRGNERSMLGVLVGDVCYVFDNKTLVGFCDYWDQERTMRQIRSDIMIDKAVETFLRIWKRLGELSGDMIGLQYKMEENGWTANVVYGHVKIANLEDVYPYVDSDEKRIASMKRVLSARIARMKELTFVDPLSWPMPNFKKAYKAVGKDPYDPNVLVQIVMAAKSIVYMPSYIANEVYCYPGVISCADIGVAPFAFADVVAGKESLFARWCATHISGDDPGDDYVNGFENEDEREDEEEA